MTTDAQSDWRFVVRAYLDAMWEDARRKQQAELTHFQARCLKEFATASLWNEFEQRTLGMPPPESAYEVIEESADRVVAQVEPPRLPGGVRPPVPTFVMRFQLTKGPAGWQIASIQAPCLSCNSHLFDNSRGRTLACKPGQCLVCGGSAQMRDLSSRGTWPFKRLVYCLKPCTFCEGKGVCLHCAASAEPGWVSKFTLGF